MVIAFFIHSRHLDRCPVDRVWIGIWSSVYDSSGNLSLRLAYTFIEMKVKIIKKKKKPLRRDTTSTVTDDENPIIAVFVRTVTSFCHRTSSVSRSPCHFGPGSVPKTLYFSLDASGRHALSRARRGPEPIEKSTDSARVIDPNASRVPHAETARRNQLHYHFNPVNYTSTPAGFTTSHCRFGFKTGVGGGRRTNESGCLGCTLCAGSK